MGRRSQGSTLLSLYYLGGDHYRNPNINNYFQDHLIKRQWWQLSKSILLLMLLIKEGRNSRRVFRLRAVVQSSPLSRLAQCWSTPQYCVVSKFIEYVDQESLILLIIDAFFSFSKMIHRNIVIYNVTIFFFLFNSF